MPPCTYKQTDVIFSAGEESFQWSGVTVISLGFTSAMTWKAIDAVECSAPIRKGDSWEMKEVWLRASGCGQGLVGVVKVGGCGQGLVGVVWDWRMWSRFGGCGQGLSVVRDWWVGLPSHQNVHSLCSGVCEGAGDRAPRAPDRE